MTGRMIFHYPLPLPAQAISGSRVRPMRMLDAFRQLGYEVCVVAGSAGERRAAISRIKRLKQEGETFDFLYAEPPTSPLLVANRDYCHPFLDFFLWRWCQQQDIPVGFYYRDVYWRFDLYRQTIPRHKWAVSLPLYWFDWFNFRRWADHLYLQSLAMANYLPTRWPVQNLSVLHPGCDIKNRPPSTRSRSPGELRIFYVGGILPPLYDLKPMFEVVQGMAGVTLTICCRQAEWMQVRDHYKPLDSRHINIVHVHGPALTQYYAEADLFSSFRRAHTYLEFVMPVKMFETLGYGLPIIVGPETEMAKFVTAEGIGWGAATPEKLRELLLHLQTNPSAIADRQTQAEQVRWQHTWSARAQTVVGTLVQHDYIAN